MNVYQIITEQITQKLEQGVIPWRMPWVGAGAAVNWVTQKPYRGINAMLLAPGEYATFLQIKEAGGKVKAGTKGHLVVFYKPLEIEDEEGEKTIPFVRYSKVFEINSQVEGLKSKQKERPVYDANPIEAAEKIVQAYKDCPPVSFAPGRACYKPISDSISVPPLQDYPRKEEFYSTFFHEMIHSTGHKSRLNRPGVAKLAAFGDESYSKEELIAEIGAAMLCGVAGIEQKTIDNSAAYIASWLRKLKEDNRLIATAAGAAQKAADYIRGVKDAPAEE